MLSNPSDRVPTAAERDGVLLVQVQKSLQQLGYQAVRTLAVQVHQGCLAVQGQVPSYFLRQVALECIKRQDGVTRIIDRIEVRSND